MVRLEKGPDGLIYLLQEGIYKEFLTPMDWSATLRELSLDRAMSIGVGDIDQLHRWLKEHPDACLFNVLNHIPITEWEGLKSTAPYDMLYDAQLVRDQEGNIYADDYGLRVFCTTRVSPSYKEDRDLRNDNYDYLGEIIAGLSQVQAVG